MARTRSSPVGFATHGGQAGTASAADAVDVTVDTASRHRAELVLASRGNQRGAGPEAPAAVRRRAPRPR